MFQERPGRAKTGNARPFFCSIRDQRPDKTGPEADQKRRTPDAGPDISKWRLGRAPVAKQDLARWVLLGLKQIHPHTVR
jgi:hypothetical protein